mgnify:CR=1 FL=1|tara:strand:- start:456 stop:1604 length:1149 start_codon:yes stop_codon:yes gene_type:complete
MYPLIIISWINKINFKMRGAYINFCNNRAYNLVDESLKKEIMDSLKENYYVTISDRNFYILNKKNVRYIENKPYFLSVKSLGSLYYLFLTQIEGKNYCIYINRRLKEGHKYPLMVSVMYRFADPLFQHTLFDGELLRDNDNNWIYVINNLILDKGVLMKNKNIVKKLNRVYNILTHEYVKDEHLELCPLYVKRLFAYHEYDYIIKKYIPSLNYKSRGIYLEGIRENKNYLYLFPRNHKFEKVEDNEDIKFVPDVQKEIELDFTEKRPKQKMSVKSKIVTHRKNMVFMARKANLPNQPDIYHLYCLKDGEISKYGLADSGGLKTSKLMRKFFLDPESGEAKDNINVLCKYTVSKEKWTPLEVSSKRLDNLESIQSAETSISSA